LVAHRYSNHFPIVYKGRKQRRIYAGLIAEERKKKKQAPVKGEETSDVGGDEFDGLDENERNRQLELLKYLESSEKERSQKSTMRFPGSSPVFHAPVTLPKELENRVLYYQWVFQELLVQEDYLSSSTSVPFADHRYVIKMSAIQVHSRL
jgi:hypothetical protein